MMVAYIYYRQLWWNFALIEPDSGQNIKKWCVLQFQMGNFVKFCQKLIFLLQGWFFLISSKTKSFGALSYDT